MADADVPGDHEAGDRRSGFDRRLDQHDNRILRLERRLAEMDKVVAITEIRVQGLVTTIDSRCNAIDRGIQLIVKTQEATDLKITALDSVKNRAEGGMWVLKLIGVAGFVGALMGFAKWLKGV